MTAGLFSPAPGVLDNMTAPVIDAGAEISSCGLYRYVLWRRWDKSKPRLVYIMLNPSTADASSDDATIRVCCGRARRMGFGGIRVLNLFAFRATKPADLWKAADPVGPENDHKIESYLEQTTEDWKGMHIAAWGDGSTCAKKQTDLNACITVVDAPVMLPGGHRPRWRAVTELICYDYGKELYHVGLTAAGMPRHPLRVSYDVPLRLWMDRQSWPNAVPQSTTDLP